MHDRIYICHTFYHVYVACLKEFHIRHKVGMKAQISDNCSGASLVLSTMSNNFGTLKERAVSCGIFDEVFEYDEKLPTYFPELAVLHTDTGSLFHNMVNRIKYCRRLGQLEEKYVPVDFKEYKDIYVFCDSDPIGYYLNYRKIKYHAVEDGLDCLKYYDTARYDNSGHFKLKAWMAARGLIFIQNGYGRYCIDMEVNDIAALEYPCKKYVEQPREALVSELTQDDKDMKLKLFIEDIEELRKTLADNSDKPRILVLSEPLCDLKTREKIFRDIIAKYGNVNGQQAVVMIKQHPRDLLDYEPVFPDAVILPGTFPMEMLNFIEGLHFNRVVSVYTVVDSIRFVDEKIYLGDDFMDKYEAPEIHRQNEQIKD